MEGPAQSVGGHQTGDNMTIVPTRGMQLIERALADGDAEVHIAARANEVLVKSPRATIYSRLVEGRFPKWRDVFPQASGRGADRAGGRARCIPPCVRRPSSPAKRAAASTSPSAAARLVLSGRAAEVGQSRVELPIPYDGAAVSITLDPRFFSDFLKVLEPEKTFTLELKDAESAAVCRPTTATAT